VEFDSLADLISFGIAPGLVVYLWALEPLGRLGWLAGFMFMACGALRLARFNTQVGTVDSNHFVGLPIPAGACMNAVIILIFNKFSVGGDTYPVLILITLYMLSFLMVSVIKYDSFKKPELFKRMNFNVLVAFFLILVFIASQPAVALFIIGLLYVISGPFTSIRLKLGRKDKKAEARDIDENTVNHI
jgi:CDP-diacylglycerol--serine O-phosphatidyltransferase